jgi:NAD(P)-dependent dehydrogenase (short-subunit alcohol dehydrogenase family)
MSTAPAATILSRRFPGKRAFITGGGSGLGRAMAAELAGDGWTLGLLDLSAPRLEATAAALTDAGGEVRSYAGDVTDEAFVESSVRDFVQQAGGLDLVVNNAGVAVAGPIDGVSAADWRWITDINLLGVAWGCRAAVPHLRTAGRGLVLNIASSAGFAAAPRMSPYNATKAAVIALTETMAAELQDSGIQASVAMPGFFQTNLLATMRAPAEEAAMAQRLMGNSGLDATRAARDILAAAGRGDLHIVWPKDYRLAWRLKRFFPGWFVRRIGSLRDRQLARANQPPG